MGDIELVIKISEEEYTNIKDAIYGLLAEGLERDQLSKVCLAILEGAPLPKGHGRIGDLDALLDKIKSEIEQLPVNTRTNWNGCLPDIEYPEIEYVDITKARLLEIIDKYTGEDDDKRRSVSTKRYS